MAINLPETVTLPVLGMTCAEACQHHVESALLATVGVQSAHVDPDGKWATVVFDPLRRSAALVEAIRGAGYDAVLASPNDPRPQGECRAFREQTGIQGMFMIAARAWWDEWLAMPLDAHMGRFDHAPDAPTAMALRRSSRIYSAGPFSVATDRCCWSGQPPVFCERRERVCATAPRT